MTEMLQATAAPIETTAVASTLNSTPSTPSISTAQVSLSSAPAVEAPAIAPEVNSAATNDWINSLSDDSLKAAKALQSYKSIEDLAKSHLHLHGLIGKRYQDLTPDEVSLMYSKLGKPDSQDKYTFPEGLSDDQNNWLRDLSFKNGLTQDQAKQMADSVILRNREINEFVEAEAKLRYEKGVETLKKEFGGAFDKRVEMAVRAAKEFGGDDLISALKEAGVDNNAAVIKAFAQVGQKLLADTIVDADKSTTFGTTPADAQRQIKDLQTQQLAVILNNNHPEHGKVKAEMDRLYRVAYAGE